MSATLDYEALARIWHDLEPLLPVRQRVVPATAHARQRVANGIKLLDARGPKRWRSRIIPENIDIRDAENCILGQVYGHFSTGAVKLQVMYPAQYGFSDGDFADSQNWDELDAAWREALAA